MITLTVTSATLKELGISQELMKSSPLTASALKALSALLMARGFNVARPVGVGVLAGGGFKLTQ
jgi:hypothetical protein